MNRIYKENINKFLLGDLDLSNGIYIDLILSYQDNFNRVMYSDIPIGEKLGSPVHIPLVIANGIASGDSNPNNRIAVFSVSDTVDLYGSVVYLFSGELLFYIDFGDIRHSSDGVFRIVYPKDLIILNPREF